MPVLRVRRRRRAYCIDDLHEIISTRRLPERHSVCAEVDIVRKVVPRVWHELCAPLSCRAHIPSEEVVRSAGLTTDQTIFDLSEMALKKADTFSFSFVYALW